MKGKRRVFEYSRGKDFNIKLIVNEDGQMTFGDLDVPKDASSEIVEIFTSEAEMFVLKQLEVELEGRYA